MKQVMIVTPNFVPVNAPDSQRVRVSLPYYAETGWRPVVLAVDPAVHELPLDPSLLATVPHGVQVSRTGAVPIEWTRCAGVRNVGMRAFAHLYRTGAQLIGSEGIDLVFFSTTAFFCLPLGRLWKRRFGVPYVIDMQDPWFSTYYDDKPASEHPPKWAVARRVHRALERWTMREASAIIAVSPAYIDTLRERYPRLRDAPCATIPFGVSENDFQAAEQRIAPLVLEDTTVTRGLYVGRAGPDMGTALRILFEALRGGLEVSPLFTRVTLRFLGTDYADAARARKTVEPVAHELGVADRVSESTGRVPYLEALRRLREADFLVVLGSDDPQYSASKIYPYIMAGRPILAILHEQSSLVDLIRTTRSGLVVTFRTRGEIQAPARALVTAWLEMLARLPYRPDTDWEAFEPYTARALTARQCAIFDAVADSRATLQ